VQEFEEVFFRPMKEVIVSRKGEPRVVAFGKTAQGRYLFLAYAVRRGKVRPITAYTLPREKRREYDEEFETKR
jgi:uncharacterized DUF497 family protein